MIKGMLQSAILNPGKTRMIRRCLLLVLLTAISAGAALAQESLLVAAAKLIEKREYNAAIDKIGEAFKAGKLDQAGSAKGFLMRGECHARLDKPAQALADFNNAIWLQTLSSDDRARAVEGRKQSLAALGISGEAQDDGQDTRSTATGTSGGIGSLFGGLFGSSSGSGAVETGQPPAQAAPPPPAPVSAPAPAPAAATVADDSGQYTILLATVASEDKAHAEAKRLNARLAEELEGKTAEVRQLESGQTVTFRVLAGPFTGRAHARQVCEAMKAKAKGVSCLVVNAVH